MNRPAFDPRLDLVLERVVDVPRELVWKAWTDALTAGYRPSARGYLTADGGFYLTAFIVLEAQGSRTKYTACALHSDEAGRKKHEGMGFAEGRGKALDQLVEHCRVAP